ncbi:hypothetical protein SAMN05216276_107130 [Streptosporangium subroseum]|uniref:Uncharacterized protein n=1 Tax=Streptosporangium subroseum TaxID=106412 RepID=A0A239NXW0_9ACTN|nr:hypothetical protein SAMN05216276_107130 [Streptosporangium subroseum]
MPRVSGTTVMPPPSPPATVRTLSAYGLPAHALRILGSCGLSLVLWFSAGRVVRGALMLAGSEVSRGDYGQVRFVITMFVLTLIVLNQLIVIVGMLHSVRGALREIRARREGGEADESMFGALNRATLAFAAIYLAWGFQNQDARDFIGLDFNRRVGEDVAAGDGLVGLDPRISLAVAVVAYLLKTLFGWWHANGKFKGSGVLTTFFELAFAFYSLNALFVFTSARADWLGHRAAVATVADWAEQAREAVPWWKDFWEAVGGIWPYFVDSMVVPLTWLTVASLVYGAFAEDTRAIVRGTRLDAVADQLGRTHSLTRNTMTRATAGFQERWVPPANAFRLATRGGAPLFGLFCLCYVAIGVVTDYADRGVRMLIGNEHPFSWVVISGPVEFVGDMLVTVLMVCLLAATFDIAATRSRAAGETLTA